MNLRIAIAFLLVMPSTNGWKSIIAQSLRESRTQVPMPPLSNTPTEKKELSGKEIPIGESLQKYITKLVVDQLPPEYENKKKWGGTKRVMSGLDWERDGLRVETRRQWKEANHGTWSTYRLKLQNDDDQFQVRLENLRDLGDSIAECDLILKGNLECFGRLAEWRRDVQLYSLSLEGTARVRLEAHVRMKLGLDPRTLPPDILVSPQVTSAALVLEDLRLERVGQASGPLVQQLSKVVEHGVDEYLEGYREKLADKMNAQLDKQRDKLRVPLSKLTSSPWGNWFGSFFEQQKTP